VNTRAVPVRHLPGPGPPRPGAGPQVPAPSTASTEMRWTAASASAGGSVVLDGIAAGDASLSDILAPLRGSVRGILPYTWFSDGRQDLRAGYSGDVAPAGHVSPLRARDRRDCGVVPGPGRADRTGPPRGFRYGGQLRGDGPAHGERAQRAGNQPAGLLPGRQQDLEPAGGERAVLSVGDFPGTARDDDRVLNWVICV
jgi:hypothetical protein